MNTDSKHLDLIISFIARQMDGEQVPPSDSAELAELSDAVAALHKSASDAEFLRLGLRALGAVIDRVRSGVAAEGALRDLSQPGGQP